jgi:fluoride exporter
LRATDIALVFAGGGAGAVARFMLGIGMTKWLGLAFPWGTLAANVIGSFLIGALAMLLPQDGPYRLLLITGLLGGFTTFSAFSLETIQLAQRGEAALAAAYVVASVAFSLGAAALGWFLARYI